MSFFSKKGILYLSSMLVISCGIELTESEYISNAQGFIEGGEFKSAAIELKNALLINPEGKEARIMLGNLHLQLGSVAEAEKELSKAGELGSEDDTIYPLLGRAYLYQGKHDEIMGLSLGNISENSKAEVLSSQSLSLISRNELEKAELLSKQALLINPKSLYAIVTKARLHAINNDVKASREQLDQAFKIDQSFAPALSLLGDIELSQSQERLALDAYNRAIDSRLANHGDILKRATVLIRLGEIHEAKEDVDKLEKIFPKHPGINFAKGLILFNEKNYNDASEYFELAILDENRYPQGLYYLGLINFYLGNSETAESYTNRYLLLKSDSVPARTLLAAIKLSKNEYFEAEELIEPVVIEDGSNILSLNLLASAMINQGKTGQAITYLSKASEIDPGSALVQVRLGAGYLADGNQIRGIEHLEKAIEIDPTLQQADLLLILNYLNAERYEDALDSAISFKQRNSKSALPLNLIGRSYIELEEDGKAKESYKEALSISPGDPTANHSLAAMALRDKDYKTARIHYFDVLSVNKDYLQTLLNLAKLSTLEKDEDAIVSYLRQAISAHPESLKPRLVLSRYYLSVGRPDLVPALISDMKDDDNNKPAVLAVVASSYLARKEFLNAKLTVEKLIEQKPGSAKVHHMLAMVYAGLNDKDNAQKELEAAIELSPGFIPSHLVLARFYTSQGLENEAQEQIKILKDIDPENIDVMKLDASISLLKGDKKRAMQLTKSVFERLPNTTNMLALSSLKWGLGDRVGSIELQEQWGKDNPEDVEAHLALAKSYLVEKGEGAVISKYQQVLDADADNIIALNNLAWYLRDANPEKALTYAKRANAIHPESADLLDTLAVVLLKNGEVKSAQRNINRALEKRPGKPIIRYHSAVIEKSAGNKDSALKTLTALLNEDIDFPEKEEANLLLIELKSDG